MSTKEQLTTFCLQKLEALGLDERYDKRLRHELLEIDAKDEHEYFWDLYIRRVKYPYNENNLLVPYLLGSVPDFDISRYANCIFGESPDCDVDFLKPIREYLKNDWAPNYFGEEKVCNITAYSTFGIKGALTDMARVHGLSREEVQAATKSMDKLKDEEGDEITWDVALKIFPEIAKYCENHPDVAEAAQKMLHRNRAMSVHAGGLIIASRRLDDFVPLVRKKGDPQCSAWVEGLHGQDLQPVGLIKFDLLVVNDLMRIALATKLVKERHGLEHICALPGQVDWSDTAYLNDPESLAMANAADLKCIFQFESDGIRKMVREGGVKSFANLVAFASLFRPGPISMKMHEVYIKRMRGEKYTLHPILEPVLGKTYGVMVYQEQIDKILNVVGGIPLKDCKAIIKAISKKKSAVFAKYKEMFLKTGKERLGIDDEGINYFWAQIEAFSGYGFNLGHATAYAYISSMLLYLKSHYPDEFYTATLACEDKTDKIKEYKTECKDHGIEIKRPDINKSGVSFQLVDNQIYYGLSKIKGIGEEVAQRIVENQPYANFLDFLTKFGTDATVLKPLIGLRCFTDADAVTLCKFAEHYKDKIKKVEDRRKRYLKTMQRYDEELKVLVNDGWQSLNLDAQPGLDEFREENLAVWQKLFDVQEINEVEEEVECDETEGFPKDVEEDGQEIIKFFKRVKTKKTWNRWAELNKLWKKRERSFDTNAKKDATLDESMPTLESFNPDEVEIDEDLLKILRSPIESEMRYYGFAWTHRLEKSPDYKGEQTFSQFEDSSRACAPVELEIINVEAKQGKKVKFYSMCAEDDTGARQYITIWEDDFKRWEPEMKAGNLVRMRLKPPSNGFNSFNFDSPPRRERYRLPPKEDDYRLIVLREGIVEEQQVLTDEEVLGQLTI